MRSLLERAGLPTSALGLDVGQMLEFMQLDKKVSGRPPAAGIAAQARRGARQRGIRGGRAARHLRSFCGQ